MKNTYLIPDENFEKFESKMNSIIKKSKRYPECNIVYNETGIVYKEVEEDGDKFIGKFHEVEVDGTVKANGWRFVATLEHSEKYGNIIRSAVNEDELAVPEFYRTCKCTCDHCKTNRRRNETFVIYNEEDDDWKQVGRNCLQEYTNGLSTNAVAYFEQFLHEAEEFEHYPSTGKAVPFYSVEEVLLMATEIVRIFGYVKTYDEDGYANPDCTRDRVYTFIRHIEGHTSPFADVREFVESYLDKIDTNRFSTVKLVEDALEWIKNADINSNYMNNLFIIVKSGYVEYRNFGTLVSLIPTYNREVERKERQEAEKRKIAACPSKYVGEIKQRITIKPENVKTVAGYETIYGYTFIHQFKDADGNIYIWRTGNSIPNPEEVTAVVGTVKAHNEFRGIKQTELTRCKIQVAV